MASPSIAGVRVPAPEALWRWGRAGLAAALGFGLLATLLFAWWEPAYLFAFAALLVALPALGWLFRYPDLNLLVLLFGFTFLVISDEGLGITEVLYGLYMLAFLAHWYGRRLAAGVSFAPSLEDKAVGLLLTLGIGLGVGLGLLFGAPAAHLRGDLTGFAMLAFYFPVKEACRQQRWGAALVLVVLLWLGVYVATRNFLIFREILLYATQTWQVSDARPGYNALQLTVAALGALTLMVSLRGKLLKLGLLAVFTSSLAALILIKYRGYWVAFAFGVFWLLLLLRGPERRRLLTYAIVGVALLSGSALLLFHEAAVLLLEGFVNRLVTLRTAMTDDLSLVNRFVEASAAWEKIRVNPLIGYGYGTQFDYFSLIFVGTDVRSHVHNGYVGLWYKMGLWAVVAVGLVWARSAWWGIRVYWSEAPELHRLLGLVAVVSLLAMVPSVSTESPWFQVNQMFTFAVLAGAANGLRQRHGLGASGGLARAAATVPHLPQGARD